MTALWIGLGLAILFLIFFWFGHWFTNRKFVRFRTHMVELASISEHAYKHQIGDLSLSVEGVSLSVEGLSLARFLGAAWVGCAYSVGESKGKLWSLVESKFRLTGDGAMLMARTVALLGVANEIKDDDELERIKGATRQSYETMTSVLRQFGVDFLDVRDAADLVIEPLGDLWVSALEKSTLQCPRLTNSWSLERLWFVQEGIGVYAEWRDLLWKKK